MGSSFAGRLARYLPPFLRRPYRQTVAMPPSLVTVAVLEAIGGKLEHLEDDVRTLRAQGAANQFSGEFVSYYASDQRKEDVARLALGRLLSKRTNETWAEFEVRVRAFIGAEIWDGTKQRYTKTGDVATWGCFSGIELELERTGLVVYEIYGAREDPYRWRLLTVATMGGTRNSNFSEIFDVGTPLPPNQRLTKIYSYQGGLWTIWIVLTNPGMVTYSEEEVKEIVKLTKPAFVRAFVKFPGASDWVEVY